MKSKVFKLPADSIIELVPDRGYCIASDAILVGGKKVGYCYREQPDEPDDSGWRFFSGDEDDSSVQFAEELELVDLNTVANYDASVLEVIDSEVGCAYIREGVNWIRVEMPEDR